MSGRSWSVDLMLHIWPFPLAITEETIRSGGRPLPNCLKAAVFTSDFCTFPFIFWLFYDLDSVNVLLITSHVAILAARGEFRVHRMNIIPLNHAVLPTSWLKSHLEQCEETQCCCSTSVVRDQFSVMFWNDAKHILFRKHIAWDETVA